MKHNKHSPGRAQDPANIPQPAAARALTPAEINFIPAPDEVARKAYFTYVNEGSRDGHEVQHWLQAEAELIAERNLTRVHGFHHQT